MGLKVSGSASLRPTQLTYHLRVFCFHFMLPEQQHSILFKVSATIHFSFSVSIPIWTRIQIRIRIWGARSSSSSVLQHSDQNLWPATYHSQAATARSKRLWWAKRGRWGRGSKSPWAAPGLAARRRQLATTPGRVSQSRILRFDFDLWRPLMLNAALCT